MLYPDDQQTQIQPNLFKLSDTHSCPVHNQFCRKQKRIDRSRMSPDFAAFWQLRGSGLDRQNEIVLSQNCHWQPAAAANSMQTVVFSQAKTAAPI
jgi:hypothetical protein